MYQKGTLLDQKKEPWDENGGMEAPNRTPGIENGTVAVPNVVAPSPEAKHRAR